MDLGISDKLKPLLEQVKHFIDTEILPVEEEYHQEVSKGDRWTYTERQTEILEGLKRESAKSVEFSLTHHVGGHGLNTVEYAYIAEETVARLRHLKYLTALRPIRAIWKCSLGIALKNNSVAG